MARVEFTVSELAALVGGQFFSGASPDLARVITGVAAIAEAGPEDVTFFGNAKYLPALKTSRAGAVFVPEDFTEPICTPVIRVTSPSLAFSAALNAFRPAPTTFSPGIHRSAVVSEEAILEDGVSIQPFAVIEPGARIGKGSIIGAHAYVGHQASIGADCILHPRVTVGERCVIGNRVIIHSGTVLGSDGFGYELSGGRQVKIPQIGIVQVDDDVEIGANSTIDRARFGRTWIQEGTKIDNLVQIAHNVVVGKHCIIVSQVGVSGSTRLGQYVTLAGQVGVVGHLEIAEGSIVGAQSGVSKSLSKKGIYMGSPAVPAQEWREQVAQLRRLERLTARVRALEQLLDSRDKSLDDKS